VLYRPTTSAQVAGSREEMRVLLDREPRPQPLATPAPYQARVLGAAPRPEFVREEAGVRVYRSALGVPILVRRKLGAPLVHIGLYGAGGSCDENPSLSGLTTLTVRSAIKKTATRSALQIAEEGEMLGGSVSGLAAPETFGWTISVPARHASSAVELLSDVVQHPTFDEDVLETERAVAIADVIAARDDMYRYPMRLAIQGAFPGHSYGMPSSGTEETLRSITRDQVRTWHASEALLSASVIAVVGDAEPDELASIAARGFTELRHREPRTLATPSWPRTITTSAEPRDRAQTALVVLFPSPKRNDPDRFSADMIATVASGLGGRFFDELRDKRSLCYTVAAFANDRRLAGTFASYIATSPQQEEAAREGLLAEFRRLREEPVTAEELTRSQTYTIGAHAIRQQNGGAVLGEMVDAYLFGSLSELLEHDDQVRSVTVESMQRVAEKYFDPSRRVEGIVRGTGKQV